MGCDTSGWLDVTKQNLKSCAKAQCVIVDALRRDDKQSRLKTYSTVRQAGSLRLRVLWQFAKWKDAARRCVGFRAPGGMPGMPSMDGWFVEVIDCSVCHPHR